MTFKAKIVLLVCFMVLGSSTIVGYITFFQLQADIVDNYRSDLENLASSAARDFYQHLERARQDVNIITKDPAVLAALGSGGNTSRAESSEAKQRLQSVFTNLIQERPSYVQVRLISTPDGLEIVRVDRTARTGKIHSVPE
jgi:predicted negative regulator of RcsB-dependent stress response